MSSEPMTLGRLKRLTTPVPDEAQLHGYLHSWGVTVQAEWVEDGQIYNPVILRVPFEISAGGAVTEPDSWLAYETKEPAPALPLARDLMAALEESLAKAKEEAKRPRCQACDYPKNALHHQGQGKGAHPFIGGAD